METSLNLEEIRNHTMNAKSLPSDAELDAEVSSGVASGAGVPPCAGADASGSGGARYQTAYQIDVS